MIVAVEDTEASMCKCSAIRGLSNYMFFEAQRMAKVNLSFYRAVDHAAMLSLAVLGQ